MLGKLGPLGRIARHLGLLGPLGRVRRLLGQVPRPLEHLRPLALLGWVARLLR